MTSKTRLSLEGSSIERELAQCSDPGPIRKKKKSFLERGFLNSF